jgi:hypothetical protein
MRKGVRGTSRALGDTAGVNHGRCVRRATEGITIGVASVTNGESVAPFFGVRADFHQG